ncbi:MAG: cysteine--tRNA ligase [Ferruginibacter sp.]|nr:cysteine--tRNA ligase [Cytophagales bacterium]
MSPNLRLYNTLTKQKELFEPLNPPFVGMYVCGPTVYGDAHLGHARAYIVFDVLFRYLQSLGYRVRYVRNITDVGHLSDEVAGEGEDRIARKAKLQQLEPMEVAQRYTDSFHADMDRLNVRHPSIEPRASGHIPEQIALVEAILRGGLAYEANGSVYFDVLKYNEHRPYGVLSGRVPEDMLAGTRDLDGQREKRNPLDFALWKNAAPEHLMRWPSPWGVGFPGWHLECSAMGAKYLGNRFDIHGGGMDLIFPHHECEIAQSQAGHRTEPAKYWLHNNMITINGQKMGRSLGNFINLNAVFSGNHALLQQAYTPMTVRFFVLQAQYRSPLDFSNEALQSAQKGYRRLMNGLRIARQLAYAPDETVAADERNRQEVNALCEGCTKGMDDDLNTAVVVANLFNLLKKINSIHTGGLQAAALGEETFNRLTTTFITFTEEILGLREEKSANPDELIVSLLELYREAKAAKEYDKVDKIRGYFKTQGLVIKDMKTGIDWAYEEG